MSQGPSLIQPTNPFHIARAYGLQPAAPVNPAPGVQPSRGDQPNPLHRIGPPEKLPSQEQPGISRLLAGRVSGTVDFSGNEPVPGRGEMVIPFYNHPADRNAAATNIQIGRTLDVSG